MPTDPVPPTEPELARHNMKCKNKNCDSIQVFEIPMNMGGRHMYRCVKCHTTWGVMTGGSVDI